MGKKMTTTEAARTRAARFASLQDGRYAAHVSGYIAGHRAGSRLTKAERAIIGAACNWFASKQGAGETLEAQIEEPTCNCVGPWEHDLAKKVAAYEAKKVRK
jgi:hypothetical protein